jgi:hypothetical protein
MAILIHVSVVSGKASKSFLSRRERLSQPQVRSTIGHVADLHFTPLCAMLLTASEGERHGTHTRAVSPLS